MTALLSYEWRRLRSLPSNRALLAAVVAFALLADLTAAGRPLDAEGVVFHVVQRDLAVRWLVAAAVGAQAFAHEVRYGPAGALPVIPLIWTRCLPQADRRRAGRELMVRMEDGR